MKDRLRSRLTLLASILAALALAGCVSTSFRPVASLRPEPSRLAPAEVQILQGLPREAYVTLGEIEADVSGFVSDEAVLRKVRERAARIGADAILRAGPHQVTLVGGDMETSPTRRLASVRFTAIRFVRPARLDQGA